MIGDRSIEVVAPLVAITNGWDDTGVGMWCELVGKLDCLPSAMDATHAVIDTWKEPGRPAWAVWLACYQAARRRRQLNAPALPPAVGTAMSMREYEATQQARADKGDREAAARLAIIATHRAKLAKLTRP